MPAVLQPNAAIVANLRRKTVGDEDIASAKGHAAGTLFVAPDGSVLLLHRSPNEKNFAGHWSLPGGGIEDGETPEDGAHREAMEEMGPDVPRGRRKLIDQKVTPTGMVFHTFAQPVDEKFTPQLNGEHTGFTWSPMNALPGPMHPAVQDTLTNRVGVAGDMSPEDWEGMVGGLLKFLTEEAQEAEHAEDAEFSESDHPRAPDGKFGSGGGEGTAAKEKGGKTKQKSPKAEYQERPPLSFHKDSPGSARYVIHNGFVRPYEGASLLDSPASFLEYKIDVDHKGMTKTTGRVEDQGGGRFRFIHDIDKMSPVPYEMSAKPTPESVERQVGFNEAIKRGKAQGESKRIENQSEDFVEGYREGLGVLKDEPKDKIKDYVELLKPRAAEDESRAEDAALALDRESIKSKDVDGRLHVADVPLCRESVDPYKGSEIPGCRKLGLDPEKIYHLWRPADELEKALPTISGIPVLRKHVATSAEDHKANYTIGAVGTNARWDAPFIVGELVIWPAQDIEGIESKEKYNLSPGYRYEPVMEVGNFNGTAYDGKMTKIAFNHVAVVEHGRQAEVAIDSVEELRWAKIERALLAI